MESIKADFRQHVHLAIRYGGGHNDDERLLIGTAAELTDKIGETLTSALRNGSVSEIRITPVPPWQVWDIEKEGS